MMKIIFILTLMGLSFNLYSQELDEETVIEFFNQTFKDYFSGRKTSNGNTDFYIKIDSVKINTQSEYEDFEIHFVNEYQAQKLIKKNKISELYWTKLKKISADTVDLLIGGWDVDYKRKFLKKGTFEYGSWCGGTMGYIPQGRFIFNHKTEKWEYISEKEITNNKISKYQNKLDE